MACIASKRGIGLLVFLSFFAGLTTTDASRSLRSVYREPEAKEWLANAAPDVLFAPQRFPTREAADRFFNKLYDTGALYVGIVFLMGDPAGLRIYLPLDKEKRRDLYRLANQELRRAGYEAEEDTGEEAMAIWFK